MISFIINNSKYVLNHIKNILKIGKKNNYCSDFFNASNYKNRKDAQIALRDKIQLRLSRIFTSESESLVNADEFEKFNDFLSSKVYCANVGYVYDYKRERTKDKYRLIINKRISDLLFHINRIDIKMKTLLYVKELDYSIKYYGCDDFIFLYMGSTYAYSIFYFQDFISTEDIINDNTTPALTPNTEIEPTVEPTPPAVQPTESPKATDTEDTITEDTDAESNSQNSNSNNSNNTTNASGRTAGAAVSLH